jgi:hypothetical protein
MQMPEIFQFVLDRLNGAEPRPKSQYKGPGALRAEARLKAHRAKWDGVDLSGKVTRQQLRHEARIDEKAYLSMAKEDAMKRKRPGGAAAVRA